MSHPGMPSGNRLPSRPAIEGEKLVEIQLDRVDLPPSITGNTFNNLLYGPMAGQPSKVAAGDGRRASSLVFWLLLALALFAIFYFRNPDPGASRSSPPPQPRPAWP